MKQSPNALDNFVRQVSVRFSQGISRRQFTSKIGRGAAAFVLFGLLANSLFKRSAMAVGVYETTTFDQGGCGQCTFDPKLHMSGQRCDEYGKNLPGTDCDCSKCLDANGCPKGTTLSNTGALGSWSACIACEEDTTRGMVVDYHDCCGSCELHEDCACCAGTRVGGAGVLPWCGGTGSWTPVCTQPIPRNYCCTPGAPVPPRT